MRRFRRLPHRLLQLLLLSALLNIPSVAQSSRYTDLQARAAQLASAGRYMEALPVSRQAVQEAEATFGKQSAYYGIAVSGVGFLEMSTGDLDAAEKHYMDGIAIIKAAVGPDSPALITPYANQMSLYGFRAERVSSHPAERKAMLFKAETAARAVLSINEKIHSADDIALLTVLEGTATVLVAEEKYSDARQLLERMLSIETASMPADHMQTIRTRASLAWVLNSSGNRAGAIAQYRLALASAKKTLGSSDPFTTTLQEQLNALTDGTSHLLPPQTGYVEEPAA